MRIHMDSRGSPPMIPGALRTRRRAGVLLISAALLAPSGLLAQDKEEVRELRGQVEALRKMVKELESRLQAVEGGKPADTAQKPTVAQQQPAKPEPVIVMPLSTAEALGLPVSLLPERDSIGDDQVSVPRVDNAPAPTDKELKGFLPIPGTQTVIRIGGFAKVDAIYDFKPAGNPDQFEVPTIPVGPGRNDVTNFELHARQTRFSLEARRPTSAGGLRFYIENDFFGGSGDSYTWRLRQAYGQLNNTYAGFGWSAFADPDSFPETIDNGGPGPIPVTRLASIRHTFKLGEGNSLILSAEKPETQVTLNKNSTGSSSNGSSGTTSDNDGSAITPAPDVVLAGRMERKWGHMYLSGVLRDLGYVKDNREEKTWGGGVAFAGSYTWPGRDLLTYGLLWGKGLSRYLEDGGNDLDAAVEPNGDIEALITKGGWAGYTLYWGGPWRSNFVYSYLRQDGRNLVASDAPRNTQYYAVNLIWSPAPTWTMGVEALHGKLNTQDEGSESANRIQGTIKYSFIH